jgi:hypothetical protein
MTDQDILKAALDAELCFPICWSLDMPRETWDDQEHRQIDKLRRFAELIKAA